MNGLLMNEPDAAEAAYSVPPVHRAFALLRHIAGGGRCRNVNQTAKSLGINRTTMIRLLHTLEAEGMIERIEEDAGWRLGPGMIVLAADALKSRDVVRVSRPIMARLAASLSLSSHLGVLDGREIIYLARETPDSHLVSNIREGSRLPAHGTTVGRVLLSHLPPERLRALYAGAELAAYSDRTATSLEALERQLAEDRARGVAWSVSNYERGLGSCAAPVHDHRGRVVAAINVTGPAEAFEPGAPRAEEIEAAVKAGAEEASAALGWRRGA